DIKTYFEERWAELPDVSGPLALSLDLLDALHARWVTVFRGLDDAAAARTFRHPEWGAMSVAALAGMYAWHGRHHQAHLRLVTGAAIG
ncbi:MAG TPA: DinB family protein, partial [bacterium]|nr:DinB family protein [bacterium]